MNAEFEKIIGNIFRLKVPFEDLFTSVFVIVSNGKTVLFDTATTESDVKNYILPALEKGGFSPDFIVVSHFHEDHSGGVGFLANTFKNAKIGAFGDLLADTYATLDYYRFSDGEQICDGIEIFNLKGHSTDCAALFDKSAKTLISGDCFQLCGISRFGCAVSNKHDYLNSIDRILKSDVQNLIASHEYVPFGAIATGKKNVEKYLNFCKDYFEKIGSFVCDYSGKSASEIAAKYNENSGLPPVPQSTFDCFL